MALLVLSGCGSDASLNLNDGTSCDGGKGPQVTGTVSMPNGRVALAPRGLERLARLLVGPVEALSGSRQAVGKGVAVELVELRPEDLAAGVDPSVLESGKTNGKGQYCVGLRRDTDRSVCRYVLQVGNRDDRTLTRAFVFGDEDEINIDYRSEAAVRAVLAKIPPASLCSFDRDELRTIYRAVAAAPGTVTAGDADEANAIAATIAVTDPDVQAAIAAAGDLPPTPPPTTVPTRTATVPPGSTATSTASPRPTRTLSGPTATRTPTLGLPATRTPTNTLRPSGTSVSATPTATRLTTATNTPIGLPTGTATATVAVATATRVGATPTFTATPMPGAGLGDRVFTIREDSQYPGPNPRTGFFASALAGYSVSDKFSAGPLVLSAGVPNANGVAQITLKQDAYFRINLPPATSTLCVRMRAAGSNGFIDCDGGSAVDITLVAPSGDVANPGPTTGQGSDAGPGAVQFSVNQAITETGAFDAPCDASVTFDAGVTAIYTSATSSAQKGNAKISKMGEAFDCAAWTTTDGAGMLVTGVVGFDARAGGNTANITRLADK